MASFKRCQRNPTPAFKLLSAVLIISLYGIYLLVHGSPLAPAPETNSYTPRGPQIQHQPWTGASGRADEEKAARVVEAMKYTFAKYKKHAWGYDDILPVSGGKKNTRNGWGAFIVDSAGTLALMGLWDELQASVDRILQIPFYDAQGLVDPFETTIRYVGGLVSLVDLIDAGVVPKSVIDNKKRAGILAQAITLSNKLGPGFDSPTGMIYPRVDFKNDVGTGDPPELYKKYPDKIRYKNPSIGPARAGSNILEYRTLTRQSRDPVYFVNATNAWAPLVWDKWVEDPEGLVSAPIDIFTGEPVGMQRHWDAGHDSYYEYLIKVAILAPHDRYTSTYINRWTQAAHALRHDLSTRSSYSSHYERQHLFMGKLEGDWYLNEMSHLACFAPGNLMLGGAYLKKPDLIVLGKALLDGCRHTYAAMPTEIGPEKFSWVPYAGLPNGTFEPRTPRQHSELARYGFWLADAKFRLRPEYVESLFYAWRITGEQRYRDWAWEAFVAFEKHCKTEYGFAAIRDVGVDVKKGKKVTHIDEAESFWAAETLKYLYLTFADVNVGTLDAWVFSTEGHPFRIIRTTEH